MLISYLRRSFLFLSFGLAAELLCTVTLAEDGASNKQIDFAHHVSPILKKHCVECHGGDESKGGFSLNTRELLLESKAIKLGDPAGSRLYQLVTSTDPDDQMPPSKPPSKRDRLDVKETDVLRRWIEQKVSWEAGFTFTKQRYEPPLKPRRPVLPAPSNPDRTNPIDRIVDAYLHEHGTPIPPPISDTAFLRRVHLDVLGRLPTTDELDVFLKNPSSTKRDDWIQKVLNQYESSDSETYDFDYAEHWLTFWNDLLRNAYTGTGFITGGRRRITPWLYRSLLANNPYNEFVHELIAPTPASDGFITGIRWRGSVNASQTTEIQFAQNVTQAFLGINMKCASCHDSFIDRWTLEETYALASVYAEKPLELHRCDKPLGTFAEAAWMFPELGQVNKDAPQPERLKQLADLMIHPENGRLTRTIANRIWHRLMGRGIVHPVDAMHTRPWSEDLLDCVASYLADENYDLKKLIALICRSEAYQSQMERNDGLTPESEYTYKGPRPRRLTAEQFVDAVWTVTGESPTSFDAKVVRLRPANADAGEHEHSLQLASWIWSNKAGATSSPAGEQATFKHEFVLPALPASALAVVTCDNECTAWVNQATVATVKNWTAIKPISLRANLKAGKNQILIAAKNAGDAPNPAGLFLHLVVRLQDDTVMHVRSGDDWKWTPDPLDARGRFKKEPDDWKPAAVLDGSVWNGKVAGPARSILAAAENSTLMPVRASLVKNNELMRALGRPNRDQIVTSRPDTLTTLEAIELANGKRLFDWIQAGAKRAVAENSDSSRELIRRLFRTALSREPSPGEMAVAVEMLGDRPTEKAAQDLMWSVVTSPEFLFVR